MKITKTELQRLVRESVLKQMMAAQGGNINEAADYMAGRQVLVSAQQASLDFEKEIIKTLDLVSPDELNPNLRARFNEIVETMKDDIVSAVRIAVEQLSPFPRSTEDKHTPTSKTAVPASTVDMAPTTPSPVRSESVGRKTPVSK